MILYKYMSLAGAIKAIETSSIGFTHLEDFNDPFEGTSYGFKENTNSLITTAVAKNACFNKFSRNYGVLSLTRQPLNSLMWSHYGDSHKGVVIGIDVNKANFNSTSENFIPYQRGEVIYTWTKPNNDLNIINEEELLSIGKHISFQSDFFNLAKRAFLYKSSEWAYEEEVRVVKKISNLGLTYHSSKGRFGNFNIVRIEGRPLYCFSLPKGAITEVYLGKNIYKNISRTNLLTREEFDSLINSWYNQNIEIYNCDCELNSWNLKKKIKSF